MRRAVLVLGSFTAVAGALFACEDDPSGAGGPQFQLDGSTPAFDGGQQPFDSGPTPEAAPDAPPGPPSVTVSVTGRAGPKANVRVVFHDANGAVLETKLTDATGKVKSSGAVLPAMASALLGGDYQRHIVTWTALENGDDLAVRDPDGDNESDEMLGQYDVTMPGPFDNEGTSRYDVHASGCYGIAEGTSANIWLYPYCVRGDKSSVLIRALDPDNEIVGHSFKKGIAVPTDGGTTPVATSQWLASSTVTVTAANVPQDRSTNVDLLEIVDGHGYADGFSHTVNSETNSATFRTANGFAEALQAGIYLFSNGGGNQIIAKRVAPGPTIALDAAQALPPITGGDVSGTNARRPKITWTSSSTAGSDGGIVRIRAYGEPSYSWTFVVPPGSTSITAPAMPTEADGHLPPLTDAGAEDVFDPPEITFIEADVLPSYTQFRRQQGVLVPPGTSVAFGLPTMPVNGTYRTTSWALAL